MSENISAVDWFTKEHINNKIDSEQIDILLDKLIDDIIKAFNEIKSMEKIADKIAYILENNPLIRDISSDSRLPVCSLLHHIKITSGIAVCLVLQEIDGEPNYIQNCLGEYGIESNYEKQDIVALVRIASLLHNIGKPKNYTSTSKDHESHHYTKEIIDRILSETKSSLVNEMELRKVLPQLASVHDSNEDNTKLEKIIYNADMVASAADRIYDVKGTYNNGNIEVKCNDKIFPHEIDFNAGGLRCRDTSPVILGRCSKETKPVEIKNSGEKSVQLFVDNTVHGGPLQDISNNTPHISGDIGILSIDMTGIQDFISEAEKLKMLRGGSSIVDDALKCATNIISNKVCKEAVLFAGGGNLLSFVPYNARFSLGEEIKEKIRNKSKGGLIAAIITFEAQLNDIGWEFGTIIKKSQDKLVIEKNKTYKGTVLKNTKDICKYCFKREGICTYNKSKDKSKMCKVCYIKIKTGYETNFKTSGEYIPDKHGLERPTELEHIGNSIAAIAIDGNMMGRMFQQTNTPAEYAYKSQTFSTKFKGIIKSTIKDFLNNLENRKLVVHEHKEKNHFGKHEKKDYLGIDVLYVGGDDVLIIMNAKGAVLFTEMLVKNIAENFTYKMKFHNGTTFKNPIVTISCGIAIADSKFPIYFLLNAARSMESKAKEKFRSKTETDEFGLIKIRKGAIAVTAISSAMPNNEYSAFVLTDDNRIDDQNLLILNKIIDLALDDNKDYRAFVADILTCGPSKQERLNLIKFMYSSIQRKTNITDLDHYELMTEVLLNDELLKASQMIIPHLWHDNEEEQI